MTPEAILRELVAIPSPSGSEKAVADLVAAWAESWGYRVNRHLDNVWFEAGSGGRRLLMASHLDTVGPCAGWTGDPWKAEWREGRLVGLGANDAKGCVCALLEAARVLASAPPKGTVVFAFTAEEENGGAKGMGQLLSHLGPLDAALVGEPTGLQPCIAQRGMLLLECTARGRSAHSAHAELAENAVHKAARDISRLASMAFGQGEVRPQVTLIQGGLARNRVPDACTFTVDLRTTPGLDHAALAAGIAEILESEVEIRSARYVPKATSPEASIARAALKASGRSAFSDSSTTSDWAFLGDLPAVKVGPGDTRRSHCADEYLTAEELRAGTAFYLEASRNYFEMEARHGA